MARERRRLLIAPERLEAEVRLTAAEAHYLQRVLRLAPGQGCDVVDGAGRLWGARLAGADRLRLEQPLTEPLENQLRSQPQLALAVALPKRDGELLWRMATELGIDHLQLLLAERGAARGAWPEERWHAIAREATEQCERLWLPSLASPGAAAVWLAEPGAGLRLLATCRREGLPQLGDALWAAMKPSGGATAGVPASVTVAIGPEGGWSPAEEEIAEEQGWLPVAIGGTILRTATAAVAAAACLVGWRDQLSSSSSRGRFP
jgi:16S rRNA (uracil1498-N3)-methyltransferase